MNDMHIKFPFVGNDLAVDFANTVVRRAGAVIDLLATPDVLAVWFAQAGVSAPGKLSVSDLDAALELRTAIRSALDQHAKGRTASADHVALINKYLAYKQQKMALVIEDKAYHLHEVVDDNTIEAALAVLACCVAELLVHVPADAVRTCASEKCVLRFKDASRGQRRRWCSMETCGNRAKVAAHYQKLQT